MPTQSSDGDPGVPPWQWPSLLIVVAAFWMALAIAIPAVHCMPAADAVLWATCASVPLAGIGAGLLLLHAGATASRAAWGGIVAAALASLFLVLVVPGLIGAIDRGMQKRTIGDMRTLATAIETYAIANTHYPELSATASDLVALLEPTYVARVPLEDGWGHAFEVHSRSEAYVIRSPGLCGRFETVDPWASHHGPTTCWQADIVFETGRFVAWPEGVQDSCDHAAGGTPDKRPPG